MIRSAAFTDQGDWPTEETAALWRHFRDDILGGGIQFWGIQHWKRLLDLPGGTAGPPASLYRIEIDADDNNRTWLCAPGCRRIAPFKKPVCDPKLSLLVASLAGDTAVADASRIGRGKATWRSATGS